MELFYTDATIYNTKQSDPSKSLGGYLSSSKIPSGSLENMFSSISQLTVNNDTYEIIGIILKNTSGVIKNNVKIWVELPIDSVVNIEAAIVELTQDNNGYFMENIPNRNSLPYEATFYDIETETNALDLGNMNNGAMFGIWLKRQLNPSTAALTDAQLYSNYLSNTATTTKEEISLKIDFS